MVYVILTRDIKSASGKLYAKSGKRLPVLYKNENHYMCRVGNLNVPVFMHQVERETNIEEDEEETGVVDQDGYA